jgi:hypothetical protein
MSIRVNSVRCKLDKYLDVKGQLCLETRSVFKMEYERLVKDQNYSPVSILLKALASIGQ